MADPYRDEPEAVEPSEASIREALRVWGRSVPGAPLRLDELITGIEACDEVMVRVATEVVRRDLVERRAVPDGRVQRSQPAIDPATLDPFAEPASEIRRKTEHRSRCATCRGAGVFACPTCAGSGRARCSVCGGSGRDYSRSKRGAKCKGCKETGVVPCWTCSGTAKVACPECNASGEQVAWLEYVESTRTSVAFAEKSPTLRAHPRLCEERFLSQRDLDAFTLFVTVQHKDAIPPSFLEEADAKSLAHIAPVTDPRLERIRAQQFLRFGVVRRDVRYEMCGASGTVSLSGATLVGASSPDALHPIYRRLKLLGGVAFGLIVFASVWYSAFAGPTAYFARANSWIGWISTGGVVAALLAAASGLRRLRPGSRWWPSSLFEKGCAASFVVALVCAPLIAFVGRPTVSGARADIAAGDFMRADSVVEALKATRPSEDVTAVGDELAIAMAERVSGDERVARLDAIAAHPGPRADYALGRARQARVEAIRALLVAGRSADALARLDRWSGDLASNPELPELRAQAYDLRAAQCPDAACRFLAVRSADVARSSPARAQTVADARQKLFAALQPKEAADSDQVARVHALRVAAAMAVTIKAASPDAELVQRAEGAATAMAAELSKVRLVGAPIALVNEVLERPKAGSPLTGWQELDGVAVYLADTGGRCAGVYVVGATQETRSLSGKEPGLKRLLALATGSATAALPPRPKSRKDHEISQWSDGGTPVLARWYGEALMELRVGAATP